METRVAHELYFKVCKQMMETKYAIIEYLIEAIENDFDGEFATIDGNTLYIDPETKELRYSDDTGNPSVEAMDCFEVVRIYGEFEDTLADMEENGEFDEDDEEEE